MIAHFDFETYSEAGYHWLEGRWRPLSKSKPGIQAVGASAYSEHPSTIVLCLAYDLQDGRGPRMWTPLCPPPTDLFEYIAAGGLIEAHNSAFEQLIWDNVCTPKLGWPPLPPEQLRCSSGKVSAHSLPGSLANAGAALGVQNQKLKSGSTVIRRYCIPRNPTKKDDRIRIPPESELYEYNLGDIAAESAISSAVPELSAAELEVWQMDQRINSRGVCIDMEAHADCVGIVKQAEWKYNKEIYEITNGAVRDANDLNGIKEFLGAKRFISLSAEVIEAALADSKIQGNSRRVLEIRSILGSASVKKLYSIAHRLSRDGRLRGLFQYCGAERTGRWAGRGPQPQNLPSSGPPVSVCACGKHHGRNNATCPWCGGSGTSKPTEWGIGAVEDALTVISWRDLDKVEQYFGDPLSTVSGCLRGLFIAEEGRDFICSDYNAIEAVALAFASGEEWRMDVFRTHGKIYEMSASKITGIPFSDFIEYAKVNKEHHPMRKKVGKVAELASGYGGGYGAWIAFHADDHLSEPEIREAIKAWRKASPNIVNFWYRLEEAAVMAVQNPGQCFAYRDIAYGVKDDILYCKLLSGRMLSYHKPRLTPTLTPWGKHTFQLSFMGWNSDPKKGEIGWVRITTWGGKLTENVIQAMSRDILAYAMVNAEESGYNIVLHVHDEMVAEVPEGFGSVEELEKIMSTLPPWCSEWALRASGGWRGKRYRKG